MDLVERDKDNLEKNIKEQKEVNAIALQRA